MIGVFLVFGLEIKLKEYDYKIAFEISNLRVPSTCTDMLTNSIKSSYWLVATIQPALVVRISAHLLTSLLTCCGRD
jgi:hypothetical protein